MKHFVYVFIVLWSIKYIQIIKKLGNLPNLVTMLYGAPKRSRTPNLLVRSQTLCPVELWAHNMEAPTGLEPVNRSFADSCLGLLAMVPQELISNCRVMYYIIIGFYKKNIYKNRDQFKLNSHYFFFFLGY